MLRYEALRQIPPGLAGLVFCHVFAKTYAMLALLREPDLRPFRRMMRRYAREWSRAGFAALAGDWRESYE